MSSTVHVQVWETLLWTFCSVFGLMAWIALAFGVGPGRRS